MLQNLFVLLWLCSNLVLGQRATFECDKWANEFAGQQNYIDSPIFVVRKTFPFGVSNQCSAILLSSQYVLTSGPCGDELITGQSQVFSNKDDFEIITNVYLYDYEPVDIHNSIALLKLKREIDVTKIRPACLWTNEDLPQSQLVYYHEWNPVYYSKDPANRHTAFQFEPVFAYSTEECQNIIPLATTDYCFIARNRRPTFSPTMGSAILYKSPESTFITGIYTRNYTEVFDTALITGTRLNSKHIEWIESIVWSEYKTAHLTCGEIQIKHQPFITYGALTYHGQFPWHVAINRRDAVGFKRYICGGTIINSQIILTAAHCVSSELGITSPDILTVEVGKYNLNLHTPESYELQVIDVIPHENYRRDIIENDIAVLKLKTGIEYTEYIQPVCVTNDTGIFDTDIGIVPGWGRNDTEKIIEL